MRAIYATDLSAASEAAIASKTCLECLERIGIDTIHLVTVIPSNVHTGMPGMNFSNRREQALARYQNVMKGTGFDTETHVVRGTPHRRINGLAEAEKADMRLLVPAVRAPSRTAPSARQPGTSRGQPWCRS